LSIVVQIVVTAVRVQFKIIIMGRKNYNSLNELIDDLDHESLSEDDEMDILDDEDLALLHPTTVPIPTQPKPKQKRKPRTKKPTSKPKKRKAK
jgi:hypothetical protein